METDLTTSKSTTSAVADHISFESKPWLDENGVIHDDQILKSLSRSWTPETWERYLVETVEGSQSYQREDVLSPQAYRAILDKMTASIWDCTTSEAGEEVTLLLRRLIRDHLTPRQQQIIRMTFWDGFSERMASEVIGVSRSTVAVQKRRSLKKLKQLIEKRQPKFLISRGNDLPGNHKNMSPEEDLLDVLQREVSNPFGRFGGG